MLYARFFSLALAGSLFVAAAHAQSLGGMLGRAKIKARWLAPRRRVLARWPAPLPRLARRTRCPS